jgi:hypothetical protein
VHEVNMTAPEIAPLREMLRVTGHAAPAGWERVQFVVVRSGEFNGRRWCVGEGLVCVAPGEEEARAVVLVARGPGRPRLGTLDGEAMRGDAGEPCSPERWQAAGAVEVLPAEAEVVRACMAAGQLAGLRAMPGMARGRRGEAAPSRPMASDRVARWGDRPARPRLAQGRPSSPQLSLFARAA